MKNRKQMLAAIQEALKRKTIRQNKETKAVADLVLYAIDLAIADLNTARELFLENNDKKYWWQMIQLLPASFNQKRTVQLNYQVLRNIYHARKEHKLDEWRYFCEWLETLPYSELITD